MKNQLDTVTEIFINCGPRMGKTEIVLCEKCEKFGIYYIYEKIHYKTG